MHLKLRQFSMESIPDNAIVTLIGMRNTGKSFLVKDHLFHHKDIPIGTVISPTEGANKYFSDFIPKVFIHENIDENIVANVLKRQKLIQKKIYKEIKTHGRTNIDPRAFLILDDCLYDKKWIKDENIRCLFLNGRHWKISFIITLQDPLGLPPVLRNNIDYVFILRENKINNRRRIYEHYAGMFPKFELFCSVMDQCTENYECLVIHNTSKSNKIEDQVFWYKAEKHEDFKIGVREFWEMSNEKEEEESSSEDEMMPVNKYKKKHHKVSVSKRKN
jgi:hypothetical protein